MSQKKSCITGVTSGFGFLIADALLSEGHQVIGTYRGDLARVLKKFRHRQEQIDQKQLVFVKVDFYDNEQINDAISFMNNEFGSLDLLVNNAGGGLLGPLEAFSDRDIEKQIQLNFLAPTLFSKGLIPLLELRKGKIINITSMASFLTLPFYGTYSASKAALDVLTEGLFFELNSLGIQVCSVSPGGFKTSFNKKAIIVNEETLNLRAKEKYFKRITKFKTFIEKVDKFSDGKPEKVANLVVRLSRQKVLPLKKRVGIDAHINWILNLVIPIQLRFTFTNWLYKKYFF